MPREGRILIVDDLKKWRKELTETLEHNGYIADAVSTSEEVLERLEKSHYHILLLDIRLYSSDPKNVGGIALLAELDKRGLGEAIKVITISAFGNREQVRTLFREYEVADCLFKNAFTREDFLKSVEQVLSQQVNINLGLLIHWQPRSNLEQTLLELEVNRIRLQPDTHFHKQIALEMDDLLCRLFYKAESILIRPLTSGRSGTGVLRVQPFYRANGGGREVVVKFGDVQQIDEEHDNYKKYVQPFLGSGRNTVVLAIRHTPHLGGIIYSLLGTNNTQLMDFGAFYRRAPLSRIRSTIESLFWQTCGDWYANPGHLQPLDLAADYQHWYGDLSEKVGPLLTKLLKNVRGRKKLRLTSLHSNRTFTNPFLATKGVTLVRPTYTCITHGDFNQYNVLVDSNDNTWLIDFQQVGTSHILRDVATLDSVIRFQLLMSEEASLEERLEMEEVLCSIDHFSQVRLLTTKFSTSNKTLERTYMTVLHLRTLAQRLVEHNPADDISEYYIALLYNAMKTVKYNTLQPVQREHALLSASLLADRLGLDKPETRATHFRDNESSKT
ncbi:MAG TPA: response regulator [Ktedonobacteraceae bacterium]